MTGRPGAALVNLLPFAIWSKTTYNQRLQFDLKTTDNPVCNLIKNNRQPAAPAAFHCPVRFWQFLSKSCRFVFLSLCQLSILLNINLGFNLHRPHMVPKGSLRSPKRMNFLKISFWSQKFHCNFSCIRNSNFGHEFWTKKGGSFPIWKISLQMWCLWNQFVMNFRKNDNIFSQKRGGGGEGVVSKIVQKNFKKFTRFGERRLPLAQEWIIPG